MRKKTQKQVKSHKKNRENKNKREIKQNAEVSPDPEQISWFRSLWNVFSWYSLLLVVTAPLRFVWWIIEVIFYGIFMAGYYTLIVPPWWAYNVVVLTASNCHEKILKFWHRKPAYQLLEESTLNRMDILERKVKFLERTVKKQSKLIEKMKTNTNLVPSTMVSRGPVSNVDNSVWAPPPPPPPAPVMGLLTVKKAVNISLPPPPPVLGLPAPKSTKSAPMGGISLASILAARSNLKQGSDESDDKENTNVAKPNVKNGQFGVSLADIKGIKLRQTPRVTRRNSGSPQTKPIVEHSLTSKLKKTTLQRSPGGTPFKVPTQTISKFSTTSLLSDALKTKFNKAYSPNGENQSASSSPTLFPSEVDLRQYSTTPLSSIR